MTIESTKEGEARTTGSGSEAFDRVKALELTEGDEDLLRELIGLFKEESAELIGLLKSAVASGDCDSMRKAAHRLKGASASVGGVKIAAAARVLETMGATKTITGADSLMAQLQELVGEYDRATDFFGKEQH